jgi:hypothetical protein
MSELVRYEQARTALAECARIDEASEIRDKAAALAAYARQRDDRDLEVWVREIHLRACVRIGVLSRDLDQAQTVRQGDGVTVRLPVGGNTMALKWVRPNDLVLSKIDLKNGAVGILPADWSNAVVTTHFAVYEPDTTRVYPLYLRYLVQTSEFKRWLWANRSGADGRTEVKLPVFEDLEIPLPYLAEQRAIVAAYDAAVKEEAAKEQAADAMETKAMADFEAALGFVPPVPLPDKPIFIASFKNFDRWSHEGVLRRITGGATGISTWPVVRLGDVIADLENGWSPKCLDRPAQPGEWGVLKVSAASAGRYRGGENKALPASLQPRPRLSERVRIPMAGMFPSDAPSQARQR